MTKNGLKKSLSEMFSDESEPSPQEKFRIIQDDLKQPVTQDETVFLLSKKWYQDWEKFVISQKFDGSNKSEEEFRVPIDNSDIEKMDLQAEMENKENPNFLILNRDTWKKLHGWFGGGPEKTYKRNGSVPKEERPPLKEQLAIIKELNKNSTLKVGEDAYLISNKWYNFWKTCANNTELSVKNVQAIDNNNLVLENGKFNCKKVEGNDFEIVHKDVWKKFLAWYGGGPEISAPVILDTTSSTPFASIYYCIFRISYKDFHNIPFEINARYPFSNLIDLCYEKFGINRDIEIHLIKNDATLIDPNQSPKEMHFRPSEPEDLTLDSKDPISNEWNITFIDNTLKDSLSNTNLSSNPSNSQSQSNSIPERKTDLTPSYTEKHYSNSYYNRETLGPGICGLTNLGNTCFFNSGVQCLVHTNQLVRYFRETDWEKDLNEQNPIGMKGLLAIAFADIVEVIWSGRCNTYSPTILKDTIGRYAPQFSGYAQQDSHELITFMLDGIHEDLNRIKNKPIIESLDGDGSNDEDVANETWKRYKSRNDSIIVDLFHAQLKSTLVCPQCHKVTVVFDPYMSIQLPIARLKRKCSINIVYVPYDFDENCRHMTISLKPGITISQAISKQLNSDVKVILYHQDFHSTEPSYEFIDKIDTSNINEFYFALEVPSPDIFYIPCSLIVPLKPNFIEKVRSFSTVFPPFLIEVGNSKQFTPENAFSGISKESLCNIISERLNFLWTSKRDELSYSFREYKDNFDFSSRNQNAKIIFENSDTSSSFNPSEKNISNKILLVSVNPKFMIASENFSFSSFFKRWKDCKFEENLKKKKEKEVTLQKCFKYFSSNDTLDENNKWFCPHCREFVTADKKMDIWSVPEVLIIQLKRFTRRIGYLQKWSIPIAYPKILDMSNYVIGPQKNEDLKYQLYAVSEHMGGLGGGHYTAQARVCTDSNPKGSWYSFNDSYVSCSSESQAHNKDGYILFYEKIK